MKSNYQKYLFIVFTLSFFISCNNDDSDGEVVTLNVKHYLTTAVGLDLQFSLLVQEDNDPTVRTFFNTIEGFTYELGFDYELLVRKSDVANPPADASSIRYELIEIINVTPGSTTETFDIWLTANFGEIIETFVTEDTTNGFELLSSIPIDCQSICDGLTTTLEDQERLLGTFTRNNNNEYVLISTFIQ